MAKMLSARPEILRAPIFLREPLVLGREEIVWPPGTVEFEPGVVIEVEERHVPGIMEFFGQSGLVVLAPSETREDALQRARTKRVEFLTRQIMRFREEQALRTAQQLEPIMPSQGLRQLFKELGELRRDVLADDPLMTEALPALKEPLLLDPLKQDLEAFGITPDTAPLVPKPMAAVLGLEV
jgi:hypothetical protein